MEGKKPQTTFKSLITALALLEKRGGESRPEPNLSSVPTLTPNLLPCLPFPEAATGGKNPLRSQNANRRPSGELLDASLKAQVGTWRGTR